jgi:hypothetical protein
MVIERDDKQNPSRPDEQDLAVIDGALQEAVRLGIIVDSGKRKWSQRTGRFEIVWKSRLVQ